MAAGMVVLAACSDYDPGTSDTAVGNYTSNELKLMDKYTSVFESKYGTIDSGHTWGFSGSSQQSARAKSRGSYPNGNMWADEGYEAPAPITDAERAAVVEAFRTHTVSDTNPRLTNFFVQQVYKGGLQYAQVNYSVEDYTYPDNTEGNHNYYVSSNHMDHLHCGVARTGDQLYNEWDNGYDHIFDFNYGTSNDYNGCMLMLNSATTDFYYHNSVDNIDHHEYIILTVNWTEADGSQHSGAYVGFDFYGTGENPNQQCERDWKFDDWIVKIIPGDGVEEPVWYRVMCEDLGNIYDFDFNDLVFDVYYTGEAPSFTAHVRVQAAGGTMPIYLMYDQNEAYEAHHLLGYDETNVAINVGTSRTAGWRDIEIPTTTDNPNDIHIYVEKTAAENTKKTILLPASGVDVLVSKAPQKICIPNGNTVRWLKEHQQIEWGYPYFSEWVQDENGQYGYSGATPWITTSVQDSYLF